MKFFLAVSVLPTSDAKNRSGHFTVYKKIDLVTAIIPRIGEHVTDPLFSDPYERSVIDVNYDFKADTCEISLEAIEVPRSALEDYRAAAKGHNWSITRPE